MVYMVELESVIRAHGLQCQRDMYAGDTQVYGHCQPDQTECLSVRISSCVDAISDWMLSSRLRLNASKTSTLFKSVVICSGLIQPSQSVHNLGIWLDSDCSMITNINKTTRSCYASLREIRSIAAPLSFDMRKLLITFFILSMIDYGNSALVGLPAYHLEQLQRVINAAAKIKKINKRKHDHFTSLLHDLHWLRICQRIDYKISSLVFKSLLGHAPSYLPFTRTTINSF